MMKRKGLTLMELLVVISILSTLAALLFPVYTQVRKRIYSTLCGNQLRQIGLAFKMYVHDWGGDDPYLVTYPEKLYPHYIKNESILVCPYFASMAPEVVDEMHAVERKRWGLPWSSYKILPPKHLDNIAREYPYEHISFREMYSVLGDNIPIAYCVVHRLGCPYDLAPSPAGRKFCRNNCIDPNVLPFLDRFQSPDTPPDIPRDILVDILAGAVCPLPPGPLSDLSQPWVVLRWNGSVSFDYGGGWYFDTAEREFLQRIDKGK